METGHPSTRAVNSGSGNRASVVKLLKAGGGTLNFGVNIELVPVVKFSRNGPERRLHRGGGTAFPI